MKNSPKADEFDPLDNFELDYPLEGHSILFYSILFYSILFYSILFYSILWWLLCRFVNVELCGTQPEGGVKGCQATVLLENPKGAFPLNVHGLAHQVRGSHPC